MSALWLQNRSQCVRPRSGSNSAATALAATLLCPQGLACDTPAFSSQWVPLLARPLLHYLHLHMLPADKVTLSVVIPVQMLLACLQKQLCQHAVQNLLSSSENAILVAVQPV